MILIWLVCTHPSPSGKVCMEFTNIYIWLCANLLKTLHHDSRKPWLPPACQSFEAYHSLLEWEIHLQEACKWQYVQVHIPAGVITMSYVHNNLQTLETWLPFGHHQCLVWEWVSNSTYHYKCFDRMYSFTHFSVHQPQTKVLYVSRNPAGWSRFLL